jgi:hypothetical protein
MSRSTVRYVVRGLLLTSSWLLVASVLWYFLEPSPSYTVMIPETQRVFALSGQPGVLASLELLENGRAQVSLTHLSKPGHQIQIQPGSAHLFDGLSGFNFDPLRLSPRGRLMGFLADPELGDTHSRFDMWETATGRHIYRKPLAHNANPIPTEAVFSADEQLLALAGEVDAAPSVTLVELSTLRDRFVLKGQRGPLRFAPQGRSLLTATYRETAHSSEVLDNLSLWESTTGAKRLTLEPHVTGGEREFSITPEVVDFTTDGSRLGLIGSISPFELEKVGPKLDVPLCRSREKGAFEMPLLYLIVTWDAHTGKLLTKRFTSCWQILKAPDADWDHVLLQGPSLDRGREALLDPASGHTRFPFRNFDPSPFGHYDAVNDGSPVYKVSVPPRGPTIARTRSHPAVNHVEWPAWFPQVFLDWWTERERDVRTRVKLCDGSSGRLQSWLRDQEVELFSLDGQLLVTQTREHSGTYFIYALPLHAPWGRIVAWSSLPVVVWLGWRYRASRRARRTLRVT